MKKFILGVLGTLLGASTFAIPAAAQSQSLFYGEYHNYSVTFKEDGEAIVFGKLVFTNTEEKDQSTYSFTAKDTALKELTVLQVKLPLECADYNQVYDSSTGRYKCSRYRDPDYNSYYYYSYGSTEEISYRSAKVNSNGLTYTVTLPEPVKKDKTSALLLAYTSTDYAKNQFMAKSYNFPTLNIGSRITEAKIGISVDEGLALEGISAPNYCTMGMCPVNLAEDAKVSSIASGSSTDPVTNRSLDNLYATIGSGQRTYQAKSIAPNKSFNAEGRYASSELRLNAGKITAVIAGISILLVAVIYISVRLGKKSNNQKNKNGKWANIRLLNNLVPVSSLLPMAGLIGGTWYLSTESFNNDVWNALDGAGKPLLIVFITFMYGVLVSIAPIIYGIKNGWRALLSVVIMQVIWATLLLAIILPFMIFGN